MASAPLKLLILKVGVGSTLGQFAFCRLGWAYSKLCWVSLHSTQPTFCRCYCELRNPTTADFGTDPQKFLFRLIWPFFWPAAALNPEPLNSEPLEPINNRLFIRIYFYPDDVTGFKSRFLELFDHLFVFIHMPEHGPHRIADRIDAVGIVST